MNSIGRYVMSVKNTVTLQPSSTGAQRYCKKIDAEIAVLSCPATSHMTRYEFEVGQAETIISTRKNEASYENPHGFIAYRKCADAYQYCAEVQ